MLALGESSGERGEGQILYGLLSFPHEVGSWSSAAGPRKAVSGCGKRKAVLRMFMRGLKIEWARKCSMIVRKC